MVNVMPSQCEARSLPGFIQQLAVSYVAKGYWFYVTGQVPDHKDPAVVDAKLFERYGVGISQWARARRKRAGFASVRYLRHGRFFVLMATHGKHPLFEQEQDIRDIRRRPLKYGGYSVSYRWSSVTGRSHASVRIEREEYLALKSYFLALAKHRSVEHLEELFRSLPYEPYAPIRRQFLTVLRAVNRERAAAGFEAVPARCLRFKRRSVRVFERKKNLEGAA